MLVPAGLRAAPPPLAESALQGWMAQLDARRASESPQWRALIHAPRAEPHIHDPGFLLSAGHFSARAELQATLIALYRSSDARCRFPARYLWLRGFGLPELDLGACSDYQDFRRRAPLQRMSLVFVSEIISQPTSVMGHSFLKLEGSDAQGRNLAHAITFYTDAQTYNIPKLVFEATVTGKRGFFALSPYAEQLRRYVEEENRTVWEYPLAFSPEQLELLQAHIIELKYTRLTYVFQRFNCADLVHEILSVGDPGLPVSNWLLTPAGSIRLAQQRGLLGPAQVLAPDPWVIRATQQASPVPIAEGIRAVVERDAVVSDEAPSNTADAFLFAQGAAAFNDWSFGGGRIDTARHQRNAADLQRLQARWPELRLVPDASGNPANSLPDSGLQWRLGAASGRTQARLSFLPASHHLYDDNRAYFGESELAIMEGTLRYRPESGELALESLVPISVISLLPRDPLIGGVSGKFSLAYRPLLDEALREHPAYAVEGAGGWTWRRGSDLDFFLLGGAGLSYRQQDLHLSQTLEMGLILREIANLKTTLSTKGVFNETAAGEAYLDTGLTQSWFASRRFSLMIDARVRTAEGGATDQRIEAGLNYRF